MGQTGGVVLVVEDHPALLAGLKDGLSADGFEVLTASTGLDGLLLAKDRSPDAIVLDLLLPDLDGLAALQAMRRDKMTTPVMILSARDSIADRVKGLNLGADDYMTKPFSLEELTARLRCLMRRAVPVANEDAVIESHGVSINRFTRQVTREGEKLELTPRDYDLLEYFVRNAGKVLGRESLATDLWNSPSASWTNVIEVQVRSLRNKLERRTWPTLLHTIRGQGYFFGGFRK
jgi:DNA-binding response OmpR family regulator